MTFALEPNKTTAFVSRSSGGKTTMFSIIERFYDVTSGAILYGKENIEHFNLTEWRGLFGYVSQNAREQFVTTSCTGRMEQMNKRYLLH